MKRIIIIFTLILINCNTFNNVSQNNFSSNTEPSNLTGCSQIQIIKDRLICIGKLTKQLEDIRNANIKIEKEKIERIDQKYVKYKYNYCFTDNDKNKLLCFDSIHIDYEPTTLSIVYDFSLKFGLGFIVGIMTGIYII